MTDQMPDLRELTEDEAELVAAHPLPKGVPDALVNKSQLEVGLGVSGTTISNWLRRAARPSRCRLKMLPPTGAPISFGSQWPMRG